MRKHVLIISESAPPKTGAESLQFSKILKELDNNEFEFTIITTKPLKKGWRKSDLSLLDSLDKVENIIEINTNTFFLFEKLGFNKKFENFEKKVIYKLKRKPDLIYSRYTPIESHLLAYKLFKYYNVPWITHFSDPFYKNPYNKKYSSNEIKETELKIISSSSAVSFTSYSTLKLYSNRYSEFQKKFFLSQNCYTKFDFNKNNKNENKFIFLHAGNFMEKEIQIYFFKQLKN